MAVPKGKASKSRTSRRHSINRKLTLPKLVEDKNSGAMIRSHRLDATTGEYNGRMIIDVEEEEN